MATARVAAGKGGTFAHPKHETRGEQRAQAGHRSGCHRCQRPRQPADRQCAPCAKAIGHPAADQLKRRISVVERCKREAELDIAKAKVLLDHHRSGREVHSVDKQDEVHQAQNDQEIPGGASFEAEHHVARPPPRCAIRGTAGTAKLASLSSREVVMLFRPGPGWPETGSGFLGIAYPCHRRRGMPSRDGSSEAAEWGSTAAPSLGCGNSGLAFPGALRHKCTPKTVTGPAPRQG